MVGKRAGRTTAATSLRALPLCLWLGLALGMSLSLAGCAHPPGTSSGSAASGSLQAQASPPPTGPAPAAAQSPALHDASPGPASPGSASGFPPTAPTPPGTARSVTAPSVTAPSVTPEVPDPAPAPPVAVSPPAAAADPAPAGASVPGDSSGGPEDRALQSGPAIYLVAIDDGGARGARFGCNDSLVAVRSTGPASGAPAVSGGDGRDSQNTQDAPDTPDAEAQDGQASAGTAQTTAVDPLETVMSRLLSPDNVPAGSGLYNALSASTLKYVSGYFDGTTTVVNLSGELRQGGVCDSPRIEAQLTQTAIAATGASRAEVHIGGRPLSEILSLR